MKTKGFIPLRFQEKPVDEMRTASREDYELLNRRRSVRQFSDRPVPRDIIENCLRSAGTAPSGANLQPWHFAVVGDPDIKRKIREGAEIEEREFYGGRAPQEWLDALAHLGTDHNKPFLETAPYLIVVFGKKFLQDESGKRTHVYYSTESVGLATGMLIASLHRAGLATLTHTPSPMRFLCEILGRPEIERPFLVLVVGYPEDGAEVPDIERKPLDEIATFY